MVAWRIPWPEEPGGLQFMGSKESDTTQATQHKLNKSFPGGDGGKEFTCQCKRCKRHEFSSRVPWRRAWKPTPVFLPGELQGQRSLVGYSPWGRQELYTTE